MQAQQQRPVVVDARPQQQQQQQHVAATSRSAPQQQQQQQQQRSYNLSTTYANQNSRSAQTVFSCLYTHQKTQKKKRWKDGRLVLLKTGRAKLHDASPAAGSGDPPMDECEITPAQQRAILSSQETRLETERYLITAEGPWTGAPVMPSTSILQNKTASSMNKILTKKFQKPSRYVPAQASQRPAWQERLAKRQRPLQPGELRRLHYGESSSHPAHPNPNPNQAGYSNHNNPNPNLNSYPNGRPGSGVLMNQPQYQRGSFGSGAPPPPSFEPEQQRPPVQANPLLPPQQNQNQQQWNAPPVGDQQQQQPANHDPEFTTGPPDSFSLGGSTANEPDQQQPQPFSFAATPPPQSRGSTSTTFMANEFRASQFYGEEEEEENDTASQNVVGATSDVWGMAATTTASNETHTSGSTDIWGQFKGSSDEPGDLSGGGIQDEYSSAPLTSEPERPSPVGPTARTGPLKDQAIDQENPVSANNPSNASGGSTSTTNLHALFGVPPPPALEEETQPQQQASSQFVLPPASDSSSDSEEDHSQEQS